MSNIRKRDPEATRNAILDAAEPLFLEKGFSKVALSEIARAADVTKSLIHHHFGSKDALWTEVKQRYFADYFDRQQEMLVNAEPSLELLMASVKIYFRYLQHKPDFARMISWMMLEEDETCADMDRELIALGTEKIRQSQELGHIRTDISAESVLISFLSLVENWFLSRERFCKKHFSQLTDAQRDSADLDDAYLGDMLKIFFEGVRHPKS